MIVNIKLTTAGSDTGNLFDIYTNLDNYATPVATDVYKTSLWEVTNPQGHNITIDDAATTVRVASKGTCTSFVNISITRNT